jgi:hypothetical protein
MRIVSGVQVLVGVALLSLALAPSATARAFHRPPSNHPGSNHPDQASDAGRGEESRPADSGSPGAGEREPGTDPELSADARERREQHRRRCRHRARLDVPGDCSDYDGYYEPAPGSAPAEPREATEAAAPAKLAPPALPDGNTQSFTPQLTGTLREQLASAHRNWTDAKSQLDEANAVWARAEYQADQKGSAVDPAIVAEQERAQREANAAHAALLPLVEQARDQGVSPELVNLIER